MGKDTHIRRVPPCPAYDLEAMESWLMDMAREGWHLEDQGSLRPGQFPAGRPREDQYRLVGFWKPPSMDTSWGSNSPPNTSVTSRRRRPWT